VTRIGHQSGGVVLSTATVSPERWCRALASALVEVAGHSEVAVAALRRLTAP
jgi:hypothetical protein